MEKWVVALSLGRKLTSEASPGISSVQRSHRLAVDVEAYSARVDNTLRSKITDLSTLRNLRRKAGVWSIRCWSRQGAPDRQRRPYCR